MRKCFNRIESLEVRTVLDASGLCAACPIEFDDSQFVTELEDDTLRFASLNVGRTNDGVLDNDETVLIGEYPITIRQVKELLHGFAESIGTDLFPETLDLRLSAWGTGSGSTSVRFEAFMVEQLESQLPCAELQFSGPVNFELPGNGGEFFTGGFLELGEDGRGGLLRGGDIVHVVDGYEIESTVLQTTLIVHGESLGEVSFEINQDFRLIDEFDQVWQPERDDYQIINPVDERLPGDANRDRVVDTRDFLALSSNFNSVDAVWADGDFNGDTIVDVRDFLILSRSFGNAIE